MALIRTVETQHSRYVLNYTDRTFTRERIHPDAAVLRTEGVPHPFTSAEIIDDTLRIVDTASGYWSTSTSIVSDEVAE